ncbi:MAG: diacylglycerol kinase family lipid kinase [Trueperaceae bacterium]|nr:MAG: diacylglycerol kinase family lipid kinase [Trueperaceae bacterium]
MLDGKRVLVIVNPSSGRGKPDAVETTIDEALRGVGAEPTLRRTGGADDVTTWAEQAADDGFDVVLVAGGDGTVTAAATGIVRGGHGLPLGVVPIGTGNGLARVLRLPIDPAKAIVALDKGVLLQLDVMRRLGDGALALIFFGAGLDAEINRDADAESKARLGYLAYFAAAARNMWGRRNHRVTLTIDGDEEVLAAHTVTLFNAASLELVGVDVGPDVDPHDGQLDVAVLRNPGFWQSAAQVLRLVSGARGLGELRSAKHVRIEADPPLLVHADGDVVGSTPLEVEVVPGILAVIAAHDYREATE